MITFTHSGDFKNTERFLRKAKIRNLTSILDEYGKMGVAALSSATPIDTGKTADSWSYSIAINRHSFSISWMNSNESHGVPIVVLIQYGHMANGSFVSGRDFINPTIQPIFDELVEHLWKEVTS